jgi:glyoxylase-like metal-dependent hydrolase (beta-lactamase superfamily II)
MPHNADKIARYIQRLGRNLKELQWIVLTHADVDHSGSATKLRDMTGAKIAIHAADVPMLSGQVEMKRMQGIRALIFKAMIRASGFRPFTPDVLLNEGDEIGDLKVLHTPGHTPGSICLYRPGAALFSGDTIRTDRKVKLQIPPARMTVNRRQVIESVTRIARLDFELLLPGHGPPLSEHASRQLQDLVTAG